jgi:hypothetical protein
MSVSFRRAGADSRTRVTVDIRWRKLLRNASRNCGYPGNPSARAVRTTVASLTPTSRATLNDVRNTACSDRSAKKSTTFRCPRDSLGEYRRILAVSSSAAIPRPIALLAPSRSGRSVGPVRMTGRR